MQHVFIVGAKSLGAYGGFETFVNKLTEYHGDNNKIKYHVACKANGEGCIDETILSGVEKISDTEFLYHNAHCFKIPVPEIGHAQAIFYDAAALNYCIDYIKKNKISNPVVYILACGIGPLIIGFRKRIHKLGGKLCINPDGHEWMRTKWPRIVRQYFKYSERIMVKHSDLVICDSKHIREYIIDKYKKYNVNAIYISYGAETRRSALADDDPALLRWYGERGLSEKGYYLIVGRFVPENNYEIMIREFMRSDSKKDLAIITNVNEQFLNELERRVHFRADKRIKFVGTIYEQEMLMKVRENAYAYIHGHEVGGTNPSLLEAMGRTDLNLLLDVEFNREVAGDTTLYWNKGTGVLASLINVADAMSSDEIKDYGIRVRDRIDSAYKWEYVCRQYEEVFAPEKK